MPHLLVPVTYSKPDRPVSYTHLDVYKRQVIVIPAKKETPQEQAQKRHLRVAAYCRVSTNSKEQLTSYENQLAYYTEKIMKNPSWTMVKRCV